MKDKQPKHLEIILKVSERCNLNCSYCYVFNMGSDLALNSAPVISRATINSLKNFLERSVREYSIDVIQIDLHGGEPLMLKKERMAVLCALIREGDYNGASVQIGIQTNATLIDEEWIEIFSRYHVSVSISIDGPKHVNDIHRLDHQGRSSYEKTLRGYKLLSTRSTDGKKEINAPVLSVLTPKANGSELFSHLYDVMGCRNFDFLLPDCNYDNPIDTAAIGRSLIEICDKWYAQNDPDCVVRIVNAHMAHLAGNKKNVVLGVTNVNKNALALAFTVTSQGEIYVDDTLRSTHSDIFTSIGNITHTSLEEIFASRQLIALNIIQDTIPRECSECVWRNICAGGRPINRYSSIDGFTGKTIYCDAMKMFLGRCASILNEMGVSIEELVINLGIENDK
ncbi:cyclophane-forming radical SAM/SPASM peptide maturase XyeB [Sodalis sp. dw_96]|uniref:cyclophane-forming radical SAM/SPASM peptide maturase XyeB n=1 Tax=Sodalis sp. dw_96 TaxID=2719794 RepID=UPI001BD5526B|nr:cyclophane-forming radical SAM/SPASM peptide maturase XyeB [Sodalis sp. dw_96]